MENVGQDIKIISCFYVSDWHMVIKLLPYINGQINEGLNIATIFKNDIEKNIKMLLEKLNLKNKEKILSINWRQINDKENIENKIKNAEIIIVDGNKEENKKINIKIKNIIKNNKKINIKIINCYNIEEVQDCMSEIIEQSDGILNTSGEIEAQQFLLK